MDNNSSSSFIAREFAVASAGGRRVHGRIDAPANGGPHPTLICLHGFRAHMDWGFFPDFARHAVAQGLCVVRFSFSGSGVPPGTDQLTDRESFARDTYGKQLEDLAAVHQALDAGELPEADPECWSILGHSRGSGIALIHAAERGDARAFVGWAQITTPGSWTPEAKARWRDAGVHRIKHGRGAEPLELGTEILDDLELQAERYDLLARAGELSCPALLLHGARDIASSTAEAGAIHAALPPGSGRLKVLERTGHTFGVRHPMERTPEGYVQLRAESLAFLAEHGRRADPPASRS